MLNTGSKVFRMNFSLTEMYDSSFTSPKISADLVTFNRILLTVSVFGTGSLAN